MKKLKGLVCLALSAVMVFTLAACGSTFDGNYKEVTGEEYNTTVADAQAAFENGVEGLLSTKTAGNKNIRLADANGSSASGAKAELKASFEYKADGVNVKYGTTSSEEICVNDGKVEAAAKAEVKIKSNLNKKSFDSTLKTEAYTKDGNLYLNVKAENKGENATADPLDSKLKVTTALTGALGIDIDNVVSFDTLTEFAGEIVMQSAEELNKAGVKVYMDKTDDMLKVKYVLDKDAYAKLGIGDSKAEFEVKEYYVVVVLDNNKGLYGVKVKCEVKATRNDKVTTSKVEGSVEKTDKGVKFPSFDKYEEATLENATKTVKGMAEFFMTVAQNVGELFD